ncbi:MAG: alpha-amylase family glycosyl hydrolase [Acidimicrobiales bacterium]
MPEPEGASSTPISAATQATRWWLDAVGYEVYIRSFADTSASGIGDLGGVTAHLDHLADLGIGIVWITPFYRSPMADYGYDVADYRAVDPLFGDLDDLDELLDQAHRRDLRVVLDLVPNHCSSEHPWFAEAVAEPDGNRRDYFIWRDPAPDGGPPNNWVGYFGGPAWTLDEQSGQYYLHLFLPSQPDLNWRNPDVHDEFDNILRFWLERGVDGFRIDVAQALVKDAALRSNPQIAPWDPKGSRWEQWDAFEHRYDIGQPETLDIFHRWRTITEAYDAVLIGETYVLEPDRLAEMIRGDGLHVGFWFKPMHVEWSPDQLRAVIAEPLETIADPRTIGWVASSHDEMRPPSRFGGAEVGRRRSMALSTVLLCLPGVPFLYQGEELGLVDGIVAESQRADPVGDDVSLSRDGCRTPMPWGPGPAMGFSDSTETWLPMGDRSEADTMAWQRKTPGSWLDRYRRLISLRRDEKELRHGAFEWCETASSDVIAFRRGALYVALNAGPAAVALDVGGEICFDSLDLAAAGTNVLALELRADQAVVVRVDGPSISATGS